MGVSPLHLATQYNRTNVVEALLQRGAQGDPPCLMRLSIYPHSCPHSHQYHSTLLPRVKWTCSPPSLTLSDSFMQPSIPPHPPSHTPHTLSHTPSRTFPLFQSTFSPRTTVQPLSTTPPAITTLKSLDYSSPQGRPLMSVRARPEGSLYCMRR